MWIKTQNNKELVNVCSIKIMKSGKKTYLMAVVDGAGFWSSGDVVIAKYKTLDEAEMAFNKIKESISGKETVHIMST